MTEKRTFLSGTGLKILAMALMLCDHLRASGVADWSWLTVAGRLAFPVFAFQLAEGYAHTRNFRGYALRMLAFALISELPFNLVAGGRLFYPLHQNVLFTFLIALLVLRGLDWILEQEIWAGWKILGAAGISVLGTGAGFLFLVDYFGFGVLTVLLFRLTRGKPWGWALQLPGLWYLNWVLLGGYPVTLPGSGIRVPIQGFAVLALIPIWLYSGRRGRGGRAFRRFGYAFYPLHLTVLALLSWLLSP